MSGLVRFTNICPELAILGLLCKLEITIQSQIELAFPGQRPLLDRNEKSNVELEVAQVVG